MTIATMFAAAAALAAAESGIPAPAPDVAVSEITVSADFDKKLDKTYGRRELPALETLLRRAVEPALAEVTSDKVASVAITIEDAQPNRLTRGELDKRPSLDPIRSVSVGGAQLSAVLYDAQGNSVGTVKFDYYDPYLDSVGYRFGDPATKATWSDASRAFRLFAIELKANIKAVSAEG